jgi:signal transduction histidine kinase
VDSSATRKVGGTGLGLYICRKMAEAIGGRVWLERSSPAGSVFCAFLPAVPPADDESEAGAVEPDDRIEPPQSITASV